MPESLLPKCPTCQGQRRVIRITESQMYACGFVQEATTCPVCRGTGIALKKPAGRVRRILSMLGVRA